MNTKKPALGRGLSALLENANTDITSTRSDDSRNLPTAGSIASILINQIEANPFQPRTHFEKEALVDLTNSIKEHGIIQPITVRKIGYDKYQIISGERSFESSFSRDDLVFVVSNFTNRNGLNNTMFFYRVG